MVKGVKPFGTPIAEALILLRRDREGPSRHGQRGIVDYLYSGFIKTVVISVFEIVVDGRGSALLLGSRCRKFIFAAKDCDW